MSLAAYASKTNKVEDERMKQQSKREYKKCLKLTLIGSMYPHQKESKQNESKYKAVL